MSIMRYAIISDIHANLEALTTALSIIDAKGVDSIVCLGDVVGYGANPNECAQLVRERCAVTVLGNHDAAALDLSVTRDFNPLARRAAVWTSETLTEENKTFLRSLPMSAIHGAALLVHASPRRPEDWDYIVDPEDAMYALRTMEAPVCFVGHSHVPGVFNERGRAKAVTRDERYIVNVGSVGQPRDGNPMLSFGIFDEEEWNFELVRSAYDINAAAARIMDAKLPEELGNRLFYGM